MCYKCMRRVVVDFQKYSINFWLNINFSVPRRRVRVKPRDETSLRACTVVFDVRAEEESEELPQHFRAASSLDPVMVGWIVCNFTCICIHVRDASVVDENTRV